MNMKINLVYSWQVAAWITAFEYTISTLLVDELWSWNCLRAIPQFRLALGRMVLGSMISGIEWVNKL